MTALLIRAGNKQFEESSVRSHERSTEVRYNTDKSRQFNIHCRISDVMVAIWQREAVYDRVRIIIN